MEATVYEQFAELEENHFWFRGRRRIFFELIGQHLGEGKDKEIRVKVIRATGYPNSNASYTLSVSNG